MLTDGLPLFPMMNTIWGEIAVQHAARAWGCSSGLNLHFAGKNRLDPRWRVRAG